MGGNIESVYFSLSFLLQIYAVRSVVPNKSNNEIVLVLQQFDFNVDKAVQAFVDGKYTCPWKLKMFDLNIPCISVFFLKVLNANSLLILSH